MPPCKAQNPSPEGEASHIGQLPTIGQLLAKHCEDAQLYLQTDLTMSQLSAAIGVNRYYLSQYFRSPLPRACRCTEAHRRPAAGPGERLPQLQHLQRRLQATHAQERHRLDTRRGIDIYILNLRSCVPLIAAKSLTSVSLFLSLGNKHPYPDAVPVTMTSTGMLPMEEGTGKD